MQDVLNDFLVANATPEMAEAIGRALELFERVELPEDYLHGFAELLMLDDEADEGGTLGAIERLTKRFQDSILQMHGVIVVEHASLDMRSSVIEGLLDLLDYENRDEILQICQNPGMPQELFADLMALVTTLQADELLVHLESVNAAVIDMVRTQCEFLDLPAAQVDANIEAVKPNLDAVREFVTGLYLGEFFIIVDKLKDGMLIGQPFAAYLELVGRSLEEMTVERAARELVAMALASIDGLANPQSIIRSQLENYVSDPDQITKIDMAVGDIMQRWSR
jgi:hypothetical protein